MEKSTSWARTVWKRISGPQTGDWWCETEDLTPVDFGYPRDWTRGREFTARGVEKTGDGRFVDSWQLTGKRWRRGEPSTNGKRMTNGHNVNKWPLKNPQGDIRNDEKDIKKISMMSDLDHGCRRGEGSENGILGEKSRLFSDPSPLRPANNPVWARVHPVNPRSDFFCHQRKRCHALLPDFSSD